MVSRRTRRFPRQPESALCLLVAALLAGCATQDSGNAPHPKVANVDYADYAAGPPHSAVVPESGSSAPTPLPRGVMSDPDTSTPGDPRARTPAQMLAQADRTRQRGTPRTSFASAASADSYAAPSRPRRGLPKDDVRLNFVDADIPAVLQAMARYTGRNFLIDSRVKGNITLVSEKPVTADAAYSMLLGALRMQGFAVVDTDGGTRVVPEADAKLQASPVIGGKDETPGGDVVTRTFRLSYENATNLVPVLKPMIAPNNTITAYPGNNTLVITDYSDNLDRIARIITSIDTPTSLDTDVMKIHQGIATDIAGMAGQLLDSQQSNDPTQRIVVLADPRSNSVIIRASSPGRTKLARDLIAKLDDAQTDPGNLHVVYLRNAQATHLSDVLRSLLTGQASNGSQSSDDAVRAALGSGGMQGGSSNGSNGSGSTSGTGTSSTSSSSSSLSSGSGLSAYRTGSGNGTAQGQGLYGASGSGQSGGLGQGDQGSGGFATGGVTVQADSTTNTLIIAAPEPMYRSLRRVIDLLDQRRAQVLVESLIVEVTETNASQLGIQWMVGGSRLFAGTNLGGSQLNTTTATTTIDALPTGLNVGVVHGTINLPGVGEILNLRMLARALETENGTNILSTPNLLTLDNQPASIIVGQTVPFVSGQYITSGGANNNPFQTVEREDIGIKLNIRPQISEGGTIKLDIYQEVSSIDDQRSGPNGIVTNKRALDTSVLLDDGQIMVLGGLLEDSVTTGTDKVPVLGSIPVLGHLFRYDTRQRVKTNLMVFLRPYVIRDSLRGQQLTQSRYEYMRRQQGLVQPEQSPILPDMPAPIMPPSRVPAAGAYDLRPQSLDKTMKREPPPTTVSSETRQSPAEGKPQDEQDIVHTNLPAGLTVSNDPSAMYGQETTTASVLQFADARTMQDAEQIAKRAQISGLKAYTLTGRGGTGYVVRADVPRDPKAVDAAIEVLRELGYKPELVVAP